MLKFYSMHYSTSSKILFENNKTALKYTDILILILISSYLLVDCFSLSELQDQLGLHWLILGILNFVSCFFIYYNRKEILITSTWKIFKNKIAVLYFIFFLISGVSLFAAINKIEGMIIYTRLATTVTMFGLFAIMIFKRLYLLRNISIIISVAVLLKAVAAVNVFYTGVNKIPLNSLIGSLKSSEGNKNIFAAVLVIQIPLIIYGFFVHKKLLKYLCAISLCFALMSIFFINARSAYLGMIIQLALFLVGSFYLFFKEYRRAFLKNVGIIFVIFFTSFFISQNSIKKAVLKDNSATVYGTFGERLSTITDNSNSTTSIRLEYWENSLNLVKERPLLGVGIGNWKLYSTTYTNTLLNDNVFSKHPHNDFIEIAGESGILNCIVYSLIFVFSFFATLKVLFSERNNETKFISLIVFTGLCGYLVDAFFNFPLERPHMQILFAFILSILIVNYLGSQEKDIEAVSSSRFLIVPILVFVVISVFSIFIHFTALKSMKSQFIIDNDLNSIDNIPDALPFYKYDEVKKMFPSFPNIAENSETLGFKEAKYLRKEKRYQEAIKILDSVHKFSPYTMYDYYLKSNIYKEQGKLDSAYVNCKKAFYGKPRNFYYFRMASYLASTQKDPAEITKMFYLYSTYRKEQQAYSYYAQCLGWSEYDQNKLKKVVNEGLKLYPKDPELLKLKTYLGK